jgi:hypothetical protein
MLVGIGGITLAAVLLSLVVPKAAHALVAALVQVVNTTANPVIVSNMNDPGRIPYESEQSGTPALCNVGSCKIVFPAVPANHRLVIDHITGVVGSGAPANSPLLVNGGCNFGCTGSNFFIVQSAPSPFSDFVFDVPVHLYYDATVAPVMFLSSNANLANATMTLSGYVLDCSSAPCAAIVN